MYENRLHINQQLLTTRECLLFNLTAAISKTRVNRNLISVYTDDIVIIGHNERTIKEAFSEL